MYQDQRIKARETNGPEQGRNDKEHLVMSNRSSMNRSEGIENQDQGDPRQVKDRCMEDHEIQEMSKEESRARKAQDQENQGEESVEGNRHRRGPRKSKGRISGLWKITVRRDPRGTLSEKGKGPRQTWHKLIQAALIIVRKIAQHNGMQHLKHAHHTKSQLSFFF